MGLLPHSSGGGIFVCMMRILDIDMDLFQEGRPRIRPDDTGGRLTDPDIIPWPPSTVEFFLLRCGLSTGKPVRGVFVTHHDEVFFQVRNLIRSGEITPPVEWVHADAHADLGYRDGGAIYLHRNLMPLPQIQRDNPKRYRPDRVDCGGIYEGNYLLFAIACGWINSLTFVHQHDYRNDLPVWMFPSETPPATSAMQLCCYDPALLASRAVALKDVYRSNATPTTCDPPVPFDRISCEEYSSHQPFDLVFVCQSPAYTKKETDDLLPAVQQYVRLN